MKKNYIILIMACFAAFVNETNAQTNVSGFISSNTTWNLAGSPYIVVGNTIVMPGVTLTIDPGVIIKFDSARALQIDGELQAIGTMGSRITFTSNQLVPAAGDWGRIQFTNAAAGAVFDAVGNYISGCIMKYCDVMYAGAIGFGAVYINNSSLYMTNCRVSYSSDDGIYCNSFIKIDSSSIRYCSGSGFIAAGLMSPYCPYKIEYDTLEYNAMGGITYGINAIGCSVTPVIISNCYFAHDSIVGAIKFSSGGPYLIKHNEFLNNYGEIDAGAINMDGLTATIENNRFISNYGMIWSTIRLEKFNYDTIRNNIFCGNFCTLTHPNSAAITIDHMPWFSSFIKDNYFANNISPGGATMNLHASASGNDVTKFFVIGNEFTDNKGLTEIDLELYSSNPALQFAHLLNNSFLSDSVQYAVLDNVTFSGPSIDADSNYWNGTTTQHIDSMIYDFFDNANYSVVYYSPFLTASAPFNTNCTGDFPTGNASEINNAVGYFTIFPNPFTTHTTIKFPSALHSATFRLYNLYGQLLQEKNNITGESYRLNRETLGSGVYVYEITEKDKKICSGKVVVY